MICVGYPCTSCKHILPNIDGWICACEAFPDGIPDDYLFYKDYPELAECNDGIGYELDEKKKFMVIENK